MKTTVSFIMEIEYEGDSDTIAVYQQLVPAIIERKEVQISGFILSCDIEKDYKEISLTMEARKVLISKNRYEKKPRT
jgi:hypothetical protein